MPGLAKRFRRARAGNVTTLFALVSPILIGLAAFAVDAAALNLEKRRLQAVADLAAIHAAGDPLDARSRVDAVLADAGYDLAAEAVVVTTGHYAADPARDPGTRFAPGIGPANGVRVVLSHPGRLHFATIFGMDPPAIGASATAAAAPRAAYSIGSRLAALEDGALNAVLGELLGTRVSLSVMDYHAIAGLDVQLLDVFDALAGRIGLTAGTYGDLLDARVRVADLAAAIASASGGNAVLVRLAGLVDDTIHVEMARLFAADGLAHLAIGTGAAVEAGIGALGLLNAAAMIADGQRHVRLDLGLRLPGVARIETRLVIGEPPQGGWFVFAGPGSYVRTAQLRLRLDVSVLGSAGLLGALSIALPVHAELAPAEAELVALTCPPGRPHAAHAAIAARPGILRLAVGEAPESAFLDTRRPLSVQRTGIVSILGRVARITARADVAMAQTAPHTVGFTHADAVAGRVQTVGTTTAVQSLTRSLLDQLELDLEVLGWSPLSWLLPDAVGIVRGLLVPVAPALDRTLETLFGVLGLGLGQADIRVHGFDCRNATLVQ